MEAELKGRLLVATPALVDPNFFRTVVLIVEHNDSGTAGVILNRPSELELESSPLESWSCAAADPPLIFVGGPVRPEAAVCLARVASPSSDVPGWQPVLGGLGLLDLDQGFDTIRTKLDRVRVFAGYAGWDEGQLDREIDEGSWFVLDADPEDAFSAEPGALWRFVLQRQGGKLALVANFPADPTMN